MPDTLTQRARDVAGRLAVAATPPTLPPSTLAPIH